MNQKDVKYIPDEVIDLEERDLLGTKIYVDVLSEIIKSAKTPFSIGLFGGWGVGKSSIVKTLQRRFDEDKNSEIAIFIYDAWKYSKDSFRRTFLLELKKYFNLETTEKFNTFYEDKHEDIDYKLAIKKKSWLWWISFSPLLLLIIWLFRIQNDLKIVTTIISIFLTIITTLLKETFVQYKISITKPRAFAPEQFESIFDEIIDEAIGKQKKNKWVKGFLKRDRKKLDKIVIVIDNIDRCHKDLVFELLLTVKNFLEREGVIFIIPLDDEELRKHLEELRYNKEEFLRKLFNTVVHVKELTEGDLFDFAKKLNDEYKLGFSADVLSIISQHFSKNPRKIIQFLNTLQTEVYLAKEQEEKEFIKKGAVTSEENLSVLTKLLIIREEWPDLYKLLESKPYLLENIVSEIKIKGGANCLDEYKLNEDQMNFFRRTNHIKPNHNNFELFFIHKDQFPDVPDRIITAIESNNLDGIKELMKKGKISRERLIELIDTRFETWLERKETNAPIIPISALIINMASDNYFKKSIRAYLNSKGKFLGNFKSFIESIDTENTRGLLSQIKAESLFRFLKEYESLSSNLLQSVAEIINTENDRDLALDYIRNFKDNEEKLKLISSKVSEFISSDTNLLEEIIPLLNNEITVKSLIKDDSIDKTIDGIVKNDKLSELRLRLIDKYNNFAGLPDNLMAKAVEKLIKFVNQTNDFTQLSFWLQYLNLFIQDVSDTKLQNNIYNTLLNKQQNLLWSQYGLKWRDEQYQGTLKEFLIAVKELYCIINDESKKKMLIELLTQYYNKNESPNLIVFINKLFYEIIDEFDTYDWPFAESIIDRFNNKQINDWEVKKEIAKNINLMLEKTKRTKEGLIGLSDKQIETIFKNYINIITEENKNEVTGWILNVLKGNSMLSEFLEKTILSLVNNEGLEDNKKIVIIELLPKLNIDKIKQEDIIVTFIQNADCERLPIIMKNLIDTKIGKDVVANAVNRVLEKIENDKGNFRCLLEYLSNSEISNGKTYNLIAGKIKSLLASSNSDEILFAIKILGNLKVGDIEESKLEAIKVLLQDIDESKFNDDDKNLIKKIKEIYGVTK